MKIGAHENKLETNVQAETQEFSIGDPRMLIKTVRNYLYQHKIRTTVQEYICNARDAMREMKHEEHAFEITVPTVLNPVFKVRDFGPGITPERMSNVFIRFGASTKRNDNDQTGGFGIGAKSAWSYTDSFTIVTYVDGVKRTYVAHTGVTDVGQLDLISTDKTEEKNGTEIQIAVKTQDVTEFKHAVARAIYAWEKKPTLRGQLDVPTLVKGIQIGIVEAINCKLVPSYVDGWDNNHPMVYVDGIAYSIDEQLVNKCPSLKALVRLFRHKLVMRIPTGLLELAASRENIADSTTTVTNLEALAKKSLDEVKAYLDKEFKVATNPGDYIAVFKKLNEAFSVDQGFAKYKDYIINKDHLQSQLFNTLHITEVHCYGRYGRQRVERVTRIEYPGGLNKLMLDSFNHIYHLSVPDSKIAQNKRIRALFDKGISRLYIVQELKDRTIKSKDDKKPDVFIPAPADAKANYAKVVKELALKEFQSLTYEVPPKTPRVKIQREKTEICLHVLTGGRHRYTTLEKVEEEKRKYLYVPIDKSGSWTIHAGEELKELNYHLRDQGLEICGVAGKALKTVENDKNFILLQDWLDKWKPTKKEINYVKRAKRKNEYVANTLHNMKGVKDKALVELAETHKDIRNTQEIPDYLIKIVEKMDEIKDFVKEEERLEKLIEKRYPLLFKAGGMASGRLSGELVFYVNAKFEKEEK